MSPFPNNVPTDPAELVRMILGQESPVRGMPAPVEKPVDSTLIAKRERRVFDFGDTLRRAQGQDGGVGGTGATGVGETGATGVGATGATGVGETGATGVGETGATGVGATGATGPSGSGTPVTIEYLDWSNLQQSITVLTP